ncbi:MAG: NADP-dependent phosphogluconate dehydrogenase [Actinobacteria bacterium]|nr:NADP-dependent phosphogluconate dehydrogenase [Actinomycetota bacterium]
MKMLKEIGLIGLGVMGKNIALNLSDNGVAIKAFNDSKEKLEEIKKEFSDTFEGHTDVNNLINSLSKPRTILLMVPSGKATKDVIEKIKDLLDEGDLVIDGGNSFYLDSEENGLALEQKKIKFMGMGVSGGEEGARNGPAIMVGYKNKISEDLKNTLSAISAKTDQDCIGFYEGYGSGHFIKMVHNGIEYAEMQLIAEIYEILRRSKKTNEEIANFFDNLKEESRSSYLIEITSKILRQKKDEVYVLDEIKPFASNKGTGKLTVETSLNLKVPTPSIYAAYDARVQSNNKNDWDEINMESEVTSEEDLSNCLYFGRVASMIQGLELIAKHMVNINFGTVLNNWMGGCIIRSNLLKELNVVSSASKDFLGDLKLNKIFKDNLVSTKKIISEAVLNDISIPVLSASLNWYLNLSSSSNPSNLIQAQRDFFGRHKVQLVDSEEEVNIDWD